MNKSTKAADVSKGTAARNIMIYNNISSPPLEESTKEMQRGKRGKTETSRRVVTCTVQKLQSLMKEKYHITISVGKVEQLKQFFPMKEKKYFVLCMSIA